MKHQEAVPNASPSDITLLKDIKFILLPLLPECPSLLQTASIMASAAFLCCSLFPPLLLLVGLPTVNTTLQISPRDRRHFYNVLIFLKNNFSSNT